MRCGAFFVNVVFSFVMNMTFECFVWRAWESVSRPSVMEWLKFVMLCRISWIGFWFLWKNSWL